MNCPKCGSPYLMTRTSSTSVTTTLVGLFWKKREHKEERSVTHRCTDCGHEWKGQEEICGSSPAVGNISQYPPATEQPEEEV